MLAQNFKFLIYHMQQRHIDVHTKFQPHQISFIDPLEPAKLKDFSKKNKCRVFQGQNLVI